MSSLMQNNLPIFFLEMIEFQNSYNLIDQENFRPKLKMGNGESRIITIFVQD